MSDNESLNALILEVFRLNGRLLAAGDDLVADLGLTSARWQVLGAVAKSPSPLSISHIARNMGLARQSVRRVVTDLVAGGILELADNPHHRRSRLVLVTDRGVALNEAADARQLPWATALGEGLTPTALHDAAAMIRLLRDRLEKSSRVP